MQETPRRVQPSGAVTELFEEFDVNNGTCTFEKCPYDASWKGLCLGHLNQREHGRELRPITRPVRVRACSIEGCGRVAKSKTLCYTHNSRQRRGHALDMTVIRRADVEIRGNCIIDGCQNEYRSRHGLCAPHYRAGEKGHYIDPVYGIDHAAYYELLEQQGGLCAICSGQQDSSKSDRLFIDHDHATGQVRGLLCHSCNMALGSMKDDPARLEAAAAYLRERSIALAS